MILVEVNDPDCILVILPSNKHDFCSSVNVSYTSSSVRSVMCVFTVEEKNDFRVNFRDMRNFTHLCNDVI